MDIELLPDQLWKLVEPGLHLMHGKGSRVMRESLDRCLGFIKRVSKISVFRTLRYQFFQYRLGLFKVFAGQFRLMQPGFSSSCIYQRHSVVDSV
ncbi:MAG: hypothetical protein WA555_01355 [Candidatus Sulfotelmatobacter sp.]